MKHVLIFAGICLLSASTSFAQPSYSASQTVPVTAPTPSRQVSNYDVPPFSRMSVGAGVSTLGIGFQASTALNSHINIRGIGNVFGYSTNFTTSGIPVSANLTLQSGGVVADFYPLHVGLRLSGGLLFANQNGASATANIPGGNSFTLNHQTYYSSNTNPLAGTGSLALNKSNPGGLVTLGWGNHVKRSGHISIPFEVGAAFVGAPKVGLALSGAACTDQAQTMCTNIADPKNPIAQQFQGDLNSQIAKWNSDLNVLSAYPVISIGIAYSWQTKAY